MLLEAPCGARPSAWDVERCQNIRDLLRYLGLHLLHFLVNGGRVVEYVRLKPTQSALLIAAVGEYVELGELLVRQERRRCVSLFGDLEEARQEGADALARSDVDRVVFTATRSIGSILEVYCEAFDDTGTSCAVACAYRKAGLGRKRAGENYFAEPPEPLPETTAQRQARFDFDDFVQDMLANPIRGLFFGESVQIYLPAHRREGVVWQGCEEAHNLDEACLRASDVQDSDYVGVVFRSSKSLTIAVWDLTSEARVAFRIPVKKTFTNPTKIVGSPQQLPPPPPVKEGMD